MPPAHNLPAVQGSEKCKKIPFFVIGIVKTRGGISIIKEVKLSQTMDGNLYWGHYMFDGMN